MSFFLSLMTFVVFCGAFSILLSLFACLVRGCILLSVLVSMWPGPFVELCSWVNTIFPVNLDRLGVHFVVVYMGGFEEGDGHMSEDPK